MASAQRGSVVSELHSDLGYRVQVLGSGLVYKVEGWGLGCMFEGVEFRASIPAATCEALPLVNTCFPEAVKLVIHKKATIHEVRVEG